MKVDLHLLMAKNIFNICIKSRINSEIQWIPRTENQQADYLSHLIDPDDWHISAELFQCLEDRWGPLSVYCFAIYYKRVWMEGGGGGAKFQLSVKN